LCNTRSLTSYNIVASFLHSGRYYMLLVELQLSLLRPIHPFESAEIILLQLAQYVCKLGCFKIVIGVSDQISAAVGR
jgi:hypothetical protein